MVHLLAFPKLVLSRHLRIFGVREDWALLLHTQSDKASLPFLSTSSPDLLMHVLFIASNLCFLVLYFSEEK